MQNKLAASAALTLAVLASAPASAAFCVNSLALGGTSSTADYDALTTSANGCSTAMQQGFTADGLKGRHTELLVVGATAKPDLLAYQSTRFLDWGEYVRGAGSQAIDAASSLLGTQYDLYSIIRSGGTVSLSSGKFTAVHASFELWADQFGAPGASGTVRVGWDLGLNPFLTGAGDDKLLLSGSFDTGSGLAASPGTFSFAFSSIVLQTLGSSYFIAPGSLSSLLLVDGDVETPGFNVRAPGVFEVAGRVSAGGSASVNVPEPGSLALTSLALLGLGAVARQRRRA